MLLHKKMWGLGVFRAHDPDCCCYNRNPSIFKSLQYRDNACDGHTNICALGVCLCYHLFMYLIFANVEQCISLYSCTFLDLSIKLDIDFNISSAGIQIYNNQTFSLLSTEDLGQFKIMLLNPQKKQVVVRFCVCANNVVLAVKHTPSVKNKQRVNCCVYFINNDQDVYW